jgi:hypothetical protein
VTYDPDCGEVNSSYCVRLLPAGGGPFGTEIDVDGYGSYCPGLYGFDVFTPAGSGVGNRLYHAEDDLKELSFAQITNEDLSGTANYRTILDGVSWHHMTARNAGGVGEGLCPRDLPSIVEAIRHEIAAALKWGFEVPDEELIPDLRQAKDLAACAGTWQTLPAGVEAEEVPAAVDRLYRNRPNPFKPTTEIRYRLARAGRVEVAIYDVNGRLVRTLVDGAREAGLHAVVWDGTNDAGSKVGSGVYWSRMRTASYVSNMKVLVLK